MTCFLLGPMSRKLKHKRCITNLQIHFNLFIYFCTAFNVEVLMSSETPSVPNNICCYRQVCYLAYWRDHLIMHVTVAGAGQEIVSLVFNFTTYTIRVAYQVPFVKMLVQ